jgi:uncharacterized protein YndB with AHSA1/START domain
MPLPALILAILAAAAQAPKPGADYIVVTGHVWAPFISPMGEPFRARSTADDTLAKWFVQADLNRDGVLTAEEMRGDAERFFTTLDTNRDQEIEPEELIHYEWEVAPEIQVNTRTRRAPGEASQYGAKSGRWRAGESDDEGRARQGHRRGETPGTLQGAARYGLLNIPEPVAAADTDFDRGVSLDEFREAATVRFNLLDGQRQGRITLAELQQLRAALLAESRKGRRGAEAFDTRVGNPLPGN